MGYLGIGWGVGGWCAGSKVKPHSSGSVSRPPLLSPGEFPLAWKLTGPGLHQRNS